MSDLELSGILTALGAGCVTALFLGAVCVRGTDRFRAQSFMRHKDSPPPFPTWFRSFRPPLRTGIDATRDTAMREELKHLHTKAKQLQDRGFGLLVATSVNLLAAFIVTALGLTVARSSAWLHFYSAAFDVFALTFAYFAFRRSGSCRAEWLRQRAVTEFVRQWLTVDYIIGSEEPAITAKVSALVARFEGSISNNPDRILAEVAHLGRARLAEMAVSLADIEIDQVSLTTYYVARPQRQMKWFLTSLARIQEGQHRRGRMITAAFGGAILAACVKLLALLLHIEILADIAVFLLLVLIGISGASSSIFLGNNQRSVKHRYSQQISAMEDWSASSSANGVIARLEGLSPTSVEIVSDVIAFERLMYVELLDWLAISTDDAMELAPS